MKKGKTLEQVKEQKTKNRARMKILYIFLALVLVLSGGYLLLTRYFIIKNINVSESEYYNARDIISASGLEIGESLFTCNDKKLEEQLYTLFPYISTIDVRKNLPHTIDITFEEQDGVMYLPVYRESYALSRDMKVLGKIKNDLNKTQIRTRGIERCIVGELVQLYDEEERELVKAIYNELCNAGVQEKTRIIDISDRFDIHFNYDNRFDVYIGDDELLDYKIKIFEKVIADFPEDSGKITINENGRAIINLDDY